MKKPILVVMAAGMGSRYGGLKQMDPVGSHGEVIMDYSLYDAKRAGFEKVVFVINRSIEDQFRATIGARISNYMTTEYAFQDLDDLPDGYTVPEGREKPWGTAHAILSARDRIDSSFAVINSDDYYGPNGFKLIYDFLASHTDGKRYQYCMVGYLLKNTVTPNGSVSRGICSVNDRSGLIDVMERTQIEERGKDICFTEDAGKTWTDIDGDSLVSMNFWGFSESFLAECQNRFPSFLDQAYRSNPTGAEYFLPSVVSALLSEDKAAVEVLSCPDQWYGVTYKKDKPEIVRALDAMTTSGVYPSPLWK